MMKSSQDSAKVPENQKEESRLISRRSLVKLGGLATIGAAGMTGLSACSTSSPTSPSNNTEASSQNSSAITHESVEGRWSFEIPPDAITDDMISETKETEIVVIGAGTAGLVTAVSAAQAGGKVILFAKGKGPIGRGGSNFGSHSKYREGLGLAPVKPYPFIYNQLLSQQFNVDQDKWSKWWLHNEEYINWLIDIMAEPGIYDLYLEQWEHPNRVHDETAPEWYPLAAHGWIDPDQELGVGDGQPYVVQVLADKAVSLGVEIFYSTTACQLVRGGLANGQEGRVDAVVAMDADGNYIKFVGSKAIVMATGDFSVDRDMMKRYCPYAYDWVTNFDMPDLDPENAKVYGGLYDGIGQKMGLWVGAAWQKTFPNASMATSSHIGADDIGFLVNETGKRFCNETQVSIGYNSLLYNFHIHKNKVFQIWDTAYAENGQPWPKRKTGYLTPLFTAEEMLATWDEKVDDGLYVKADTIEEVVSLLGLPPETVDELAKYNKFCETGADTDFFKREEFLIPVNTGPFYGSGSEISVTFLTVLGGLRTDINMRVCDMNDDPIPGLYNVGTMIGDSYFGAYAFKVRGHNLSMNCGTFGKLTGEYIVANE